MTFDLTLSASRTLGAHEDAGGILDHVPAALRRVWADAGIYEGRDLFMSFSGFADAHPLSLAVSDGGIALTYAQLRVRSLGLAAALHECGVRTGDVVAVNLPNGWRACAADLAAAALGAIVLPYPVGRKRHESRALLAKSGAKVLICQRRVGDIDYAALIDGLHDELPMLERVFVLGARYLDWPDLDRCWERDPYPYRAGMLDPDGPVRLIASSGSEAEPKLVAYSHNGLIGGQASYLKSLGADVSMMRAMFCVSLASPFGSLSTSCALAALGGALVNLERFEPTAVLLAIAALRVTHLFAGPNMVDMLLESPLLADDAGNAPDLSSLKAIVSGGSALSAQTAQRVRDVIGCALIQSYGSADGVACHTALDDDFDTIVATVGRPDPAVVTVRIVDDAGNDVEIGADGEIWARGPMTPLGYFGAPELNERNLAPGGWVRLGDRGRLDAAGYLHIIGRRADTVLRNGVKINLVEIEMLLHGHPDVADVAVVQATTDGCAARLCACVVPRAERQAPTLDAINRHLLDVAGVERCKLVDSVVPCLRLPLAPSGKVDRATLAREAATAQAALATCLPGAPSTLSAAPILDLLMGVERAGVLRAAIELRVFDRLADGPRGAGELACAVGASARGMRILLDALAGLALVEHDAAHARYRLNPTSQRFLVSASPYYVGGLSGVYTADLMWDTFRHFKDAVIAGGSVLPSSLEAADHPYWQSFAVGIANTSRRTARRVADLLAPWAASRSSIAVLDLGCSNGIYGFTFAQSQPKSTVCGVDWPSIRDTCADTAREFGVDARARFIGGNLFDVEIPGQYDLVILSQILHHFDEDACRRLLGRACDRLAPGGRIAVCDFMISDAPAASEPVPRLFAAQMLGLTQAGDCYPVRTVNAMLAEQGLVDIVATPLKGVPVHCVTGDRASAR
ncbi:AMP-binding protein [Burkholderia sp. DN3021]|uniref:AMP-binding protein n=1 Tax=Burkholderia sp. DN3021 TaxID=3410137 RepID=UPI003C7AFD30